MLFRSVKSKISLRNIVQNIYGFKASIENDIRYYVTRRCFKLKGLRLVKYHLKACTYLAVIPDTRFFLVNASWQWLMTFFACAVAIRKVSSISFQQERDFKQFFSDVDAPGIPCRGFHSPIFIEFLPGFCLRGLVGDGERTYPLTQNMMSLVSLNGLHYTFPGGVTGVGHYYSHG